MLEPNTNSFICRVPRIFPSTAGPGGRKCGAYEWCSVPAQPSAFALHHPLVNGELRRASTECQAGKDSPLLRRRVPQYRSRVNTAAECRKQEFRKLGLLVLRSDRWRRTVVERAVSGGSSHKYEAH